MLKVKEEVEVRQNRVSLSLERAGRRRRYLSTQLLEPILPACAQPLPVILQVDAAGFGSHLPHHCCVEIVQLRPSGARVEPDIVVLFGILRGLDS